jgi:putative oxidoreductase
MAAMFKDRMTPQFRVYLKQMAVIMGAYVAINVGAMFGLFDSFNTIGRWLVAVICGGLIATQIWTLLILIEKSDEYVRAVVVRQYIVASGLSMALFSIWGFGEVYAGAPHAPGWVIYVLFWACYAGTEPIVDWLRK